jgi:hypothetical protein
MPEGCTWHLALDTARAEPQDIATEDEQGIWPQDHFMVAARSLVVLEGR